MFAPDTPMLRAFHTRMPSFYAASGKGTDTQAVAPSGSMVNFSRFDCWDHPYSCPIPSWGWRDSVLVGFAVVRTTVGVDCWGGSYAYAQFRRVRASFLASRSGYHGRPVPCGAGTGSGSPGIGGRTGPGGFRQRLSCPLGLSLCYALPLGFTITFGFGFAVFGSCTKAANRPLPAVDAQSAG